MGAKGGERRRPAAAAAERRKDNRRQRQQQQRKKQREEEQRQKKPNDDGKEKMKRNKKKHHSGDQENLTTLVSEVASAAALSLRFLSENDVFLRPTQSHSLQSSLYSAALSLSQLHTLLPQQARVESLKSSTLAMTEKREYWFLRFLSSAHSDSDPRWLDTFRMSRPSFYLLLQTLSPSLSFNSATAAAGGDHIPADHKLGAALLHLAHALSFRSVACRFGLDGPAAACRAFYEVCRAVTDQLGHLFELSSDLRRVVQGFHWISLPNCSGVLAFSGFPVRCDGDDRDSTIVVQALVDSEGRFLDVSAGWPGSMGPSEILPRTKLFSSYAKNLSSGSGNGEGAGNGVAILPRYFLGDSCCPLLSCLLTPFSELNSLAENSPRKVFNDVHSRGMELASKAFAAVRARWRLLLTRWRGECVEALPFVIVASFLLHNFLFKCSEPMPEDLEEEEASVREQRFPDFEGKGNEVGERLREVLATHLGSLIHQG